MKDLFNKIVLCFAVAAIFAVGVGAQKSDGVRSSAKRMPFADGEALTYEGKYSKFIRGIPVADVTFTVSQKTRGGDFTVSADARSKGTLLSLARYSFLYEINSTIDGKEFRVKKTAKHDVQKDRIRDSVADFDYGDRSVTYVETDPNEPMRAPRKIASQIGPAVHDVVSGLYSLRLLPLAVGGQWEVEVSDSGLVYKIPVRVTAREKQNSIFGKVWCFRVEPDVFGPGRLFEKEGSMIVWITDDARKIPVRSQVRSSIGKVEIKLKSAKNLVS